VPTHRFGLRRNHSTIDQVHRMSDIFGRKGLKIKACALLSFLDIAQACDNVWHRGLLHKLRSILPDNFCQLLKSCLTNRHFRVKLEDSYSKLKLIKAGFPQRSVLGPVLYLLYINDVPTTLNSTIDIFADHRAVIAVGETVEYSTRKLQSAVNKVALWIKNSK
jgi:hypothetical protein